MLKGKRTDIWQLSSGSISLTLTRKEDVSWRSDKSGSPSVSKNTETLGRQRRNGGNADQLQKKKKTQDGPVYLTSASKGNSLPASIFRELWLLEGTWRLKVELKISVLRRPWLLQQQHLDCEWPLKIKRGGPSGVVGCFRLPGTLEQLWRILDDDDWWGKKQTYFYKLKGHSDKKWIEIRILEESRQ